MCHVFRATFSFSYAECCNKVLREEAKFKGYPGRVLKQGGKDFFRKKYDGLGLFFLENKGGRNWEYFLLHYTEPFMFGTCIFHMRTCTHHIRSCTLHMRTGTHVSWCITLRSKWMHASCNVDATWMQRGCNVDATWMQRGCNQAARKVQRCKCDASTLHAQCMRGWWTVHAPSTVCSYN